MPISRGTDLLGAGTQFFCSIVDYEQIRDAGSIFPHTQYVMIYFDALSDHRAEMVALGHHAGVIALGIVVVVAILPIFATGGSEAKAMR